MVFADGELVLDQGCNARGLVVTDWTHTFLGMTKEQGEDWLKMPPLHVHPAHQGGTTEGGYSVTQSVLPPLEADPLWGGLAEPPKRDSE